MNPNTGADEYCGNCRFFTLTIEPKGECKRRPRLNQKHNDKTETSLWCHYWENNVDSKIDNRSKDIIDEMMKPETFKPDEETRFETNEEEQLPPMGEAVRELHFLRDALEQQQHEMTEHTVEIVLSGNDPQLFEARGALRIIKMIIDGISMRITDLDKS